MLNTNIRIPMPNSNSTFQLQPSVHNWEFLYIRHGPCNSSEGPTALCPTNKTWLKISISEKSPKPNEQYKKTGYRRTDRRTDGHTLIYIEMRGRI